MSDSPALTLLRVGDVLATAKDLNEAIHMACGYIEHDPSKAAIQAVANCLEAKLSQALEMIEGAREALT
ncbi:hypothetical protein NN6n1_41960 [Shinella zoogloeoides]